MLTWRLWRLLNYPGYIHPVFWRVAKISTPALMYFAVIPDLLFETLLLLTLPLGILVFVSPLGTLLFGAWYAGQTAHLLVRERDTLRMLTITPFGTLRAQWILNAICYRQLGQHLHFFTQSYLMMAVPVIGTVLIMTLVILPAQPDLLLGERALMAVSGLVYTLGIPLYLIADRWQSLTLGALSGMMAAQITSTPLTAQTVAVTVFLAAGLLITLAGVGLVVIGITQHIWGLPALGLLLICMLREAGIVLAWTILRRIMGSDERFG